MSLNILIPRCVGHRTVLSTNNCGGPGCRWCRCLCDIHGHRNGSGPWEGNLGSERKGAVLFHGGYCGCLCSCCWEIENRSECFRCVSFRRFIAETETAISGSFTDARLPNANETEQQMDQWIALTDPPWFSGLLRSFHLTVCLACWKAAAPAFLEANTLHKRHKLLFDFHTAYSSLSESNISWQRIYIYTYWNLYGGVFCHEIACQAPAVTEKLKITISETEAAKQPLRRCQDIQRNICPKGLFAGFVLIRNRHRFLPCQFHPKLGCIRLGEKRRERLIEQ